MVKGLKGFHHVGIGVQYYEKMIEVYTVAGKTSLIPLCYSCQGNCFLRIGAW